MRALDGKRREIVTPILKFHIPGKMRAHPSGIFFDHRRIHDEQKAILSQMVNNKVVNHPASLIQHERVLSVPHGQLAHVVRQQRIEPRRCIRTLHKKLPHVRNIKNATGLAYSFVLLQNARVLHRHFPTRKLHYATASADMFIV